MKIYERLAKINSQITAIGKNQTNKQQGFKYRGVDDVMNELHELFQQNEVFIMPEVVNGFREERQSKSGGALITSIVDYKFTFYAPDGSNVFAIIRGEGMDSGDKATNKAMAIALKYCLTQMFLIPTDEAKDPDAESHTAAVKLSDRAIDLERDINGSTDLEVLKAVGSIISKEKLPQAEKDYLRNIYKQKEAKLK